MKRDGCRHGNGPPTADIGQAQTPLRIIAVQKQIRHQPRALGRPSPHEQAARREILHLDRRSGQRAWKRLNEFPGAPIDRSAKLEDLAGFWIVQRRSRGGQRGFGIQGGKQCRERTAIEPRVAIDKPQQIIRRGRSPDGQREPKVESAAAARVCFQPHHLKDDRWVVKGGRHVEQTDRNGGRVIDDQHMQLAQASRPIQIAEVFRHEPEILNPIEARNNRPDGALGVLPSVTDGSRAARNERARSRLQPPCPPCIRRANLFDDWSRHPDSIVEIHGWRARRLSDARGPR